MSTILWGVVAILIAVAGGLSVFLIASRRKQFDPDIMERAHTMVRDAYEETELTEGDKAAKNDG